MNVQGPAWPSVVSLREALREVPGPDLAWGRRTHNGLQQLIAFWDAGIRCPRFTDVRSEAQDWVREGLPVWGRRLHHTQGWDIVGAGYRGSRPYAGAPRRHEVWNHKWLHRDFWVVAESISEEFRQHIWRSAGGEYLAIRVGRKVKTSDGDHPSAMPIRSRRNGWTIDYSYKLPKALREKVRDAAKRAVGALGLQGGAVDLILTQTGEIVVLEVNTAPSLRDEATLGAYVKAITSGRVA